MVVRAGVVKLAEVAPDTGSVVIPELPRYHWKVGDVPEAATVRVVVPPLLIVVETGWVVIDGAVTVLTVMVAAFESEVPAPLLARAQ